MKATPPLEAHVVVIDSEEEQPEELDFPLTTRLIFLQ